MADRIFVTRRLVGDALERLAQHAEVDLWDGDGQPAPEVLRARVREADGLLCLLTDRIDADLISACPKLRAVASCSVGLDHVDVAALSARKIPLGYTPSVLVETTADLAFALLLAAARRIVEADRFVREGQWTEARRWEPDMLVGRDLSGATLGIVGLGEIGKAVARRAQGFGMRIISFTRSGRTLPFVQAVSLEALLEQSDFVSIHVALTPDTRNLLDERAIRRMKPGAVLVNTARGGIVDELALARALSEGRLGAAGLDVFEREPLSLDHPLLRLSNVVVAPHIGSASIATRSKMASLSVDNLIAALSGQRMPHCANPSVYE
jgi:glyoxylate reductase